MPKKILFIVGNGFNYLIDDCIRNFINVNPTVPNPLDVPLTDLANNIQSITGLWQKFDKVFKDLRKHSNGLNDEELIRMIHSVFDLLSNLDGFSKMIPPEQIKLLKSIFDSFLLDKVKQISQEFKTHQDDLGYKGLKQLYPSFGAQFRHMMIENGLEKMHIYSTNYDGVLDTLLTDEPRGFIFRDNFVMESSYDTRLQQLAPQYLPNEPLLMLHLHGSYRFKRYYGQTFKLRKNYENDNPVMIFNNPDTKEKLILDDNVLREYYNQFLLDLKTFDRVVIIGNSMKCEPHLKSSIKKHFNRPGTDLMIISRSPDKIENEVAPFYKGTIIKHSTKGVIDIKLVLGFFQAAIS